MIKIEHSLKFVTEFDETNEYVQQLIALPEPMQVKFLEDMLYEMLSNRLKPILDEVNQGGSYAILKLVRP